MKNVSILIAARNEEDNILDCLEAITHLTYPLDSLEILIGNDQSEDSTAQLIARFIYNKPQFSLINISYNLGQAQGKANVLAQLAMQARGEYFLFTDADVQVPPNWVQTMLAACEDNTGVVTGITLVKGKTLFHHLQAIDWAFALGLVHMASGWQVPVTAMGNNMMVTRIAYEATGGYQHLPFSITEDYTLFHAITIRKFKFKHLLQKEVLACSKPVFTFKALMSQRRRWAYGAMQLPFYFVIIFLLQALFFPAIIWLLFYFPMAVLLLWFAKWVSQSIFIGRTLYKLKHLHLLKYVVIYEFYYAFVSLLTLISYLLPGKIQWKGRKY